MTYKGEMNEYMRRINVPSPMEKENEVTFKMNENECQYLM